VILGLGLNPLGPRHRADQVSAWRACLLAQFRFGALLEDGQLVGQLRVGDLNLDFVQRLSEQSAENHYSHQR
jgi:hypothetical protein